MPRSTTFTLIATMIGSVRPITPSRTVDRAAFSSIRWAMPIPPSNIVIEPSAIPRFRSKRRMRRNPMQRNRRHRQRTRQQTPRLRGAADVQGDRGEIGKAVTDRGCRACADSVRSARIDPLRRLRCWRFRDLRARRHCARHLSDAAWSGVCRTLPACGSACARQRFLRSVAPQGGGGA